jgi:hypothetical protein
MTRTFMCFSVLRPPTYLATGISRLWLGEAAFEPRETELIDAM